MMVNFPTWIPDCESHSLGLLEIFLLSHPSICFTVAFPPWGNSDHVAVSVSIDLPSNSKGDAFFHLTVYGYSRGNWDGLCDH